ncbi:MAG TPA: FecR family protein [Chitinophaga sp.]|uniref:FecR family protein n=1 Tax=Chitinophaga sp. TaxID=1869181 RepID=UPI002C5F1E30|nr:FecR family protein [Chitinophaga sp.]HVI45310.1 FecR family protein [Chitinophaga sp.]
MNDQFHSIEDFWTDDSFLDWVLGKDPAAALRWEEWMSGNPQQVPLMKEARQLLLSVKVKEEVLHPLEIQASVNNILSQLPVAVPKPFWRNWRMAAAAAGLLLLGGGGWWLTHQPSTAYQAVSYAGFAEKVNTTSAQLRVAMKDGSTILLDPGAGIRYSTVWEHARTVYLTGKALFDVKPSAAPFIVNTGDIATTVLGTVFSVTATAAQQEVIVSVQHGKVAVKNNHATEVILLSNQEVSYEAGSNSLAKKLVPAPLTQVNVRHQEDFIFTETPVTTVFEKLAGVYAVQINYNPDALKSCTITANLNQEAFYDKLNLICRALGLSYRETDGQLFISGEGCNEK